MEGEVWKPLPDFQDRYLVSSFGRVLRLAYYKKDSIGRNVYRKEKLLKPTKTGVGYYQVKVNGRRAFVHRLVASAFYGIPIVRGDSTIEVHHKNHDKSDNSLENIGLVTRKENMIESFHFYNSKTTKKLRGNSIRYRVISELPPMCSDCKKPINKKKYVYCLDCRARHDRVVERPEPDVLFYLLLNYPLTFVGNPYGVSDKAISKWCVKMGIPSKASYYRNVTLVTK
mgnify:CR=1 FL=1